MERSDLGVNKLAADKVALLLQMTVSGATGLPCWPAYSVKHHIWKKFENIFKKRIDGCKQSGRGGLHCIYGVNWMFQTFLVPGRRGSEQWGSSKLTRVSVGIWSPQNLYLQEGISAWNDNDIEAVWILQEKENVSLLRWRNKLAKPLRA